MITTLDEHRYVADRGGVTVSCQIPCCPQLMWRISSSLSLGLEDVETSQRSGQPHRECSGGFRADQLLCMFGNGVVKRQPHTKWVMYSLSFTFTMGDYNKTHIGYLSCPCFAAGCAFTATPRRRSAHEHPFLSSQH